MHPYDSAMLSSDHRSNAAQVGKSHRMLQQHGEHSESKELITLLQLASIPKAAGPRIASLMIRLTDNTLDKCSWLIVHRQDNRDSGQRLQNINMSNPKRLFALPITETRVFSEMLHDEQSNRRRNWIRGASSRNHTVFQDHKLSSVET